MKALEGKNQRVSLFFLGFNLDSPSSTKPYSGKCLILRKIGNVYESYHVESSRQQSVG